jgi:hypothetical protein
VTLTGGSIPAKGSCTIKVPVTSNCVCVGSYYNVLKAGVLQTSKGKNTQPTVATLTVSGVAPAGGPPTLGKSFWPSDIVPGGTSRLTIVLKNPNATAAKMTAPLVDELPAGLTVYGGTTNTCGGTVTAIVGSTSVTLTGGTIPVNGSCTVSVRVLVEKKAGTYVNKLLGGALKTTKGNNVSPASGTLTVTASANTGPTLSKSFSPNSVKKGQNSTLTITLNNSVSSAAKLTAPFTDHLPKGMVVAGAGSNSCGGVVTAVKGSASVTLTGGSIPAKGSCKITVPVTAPCASYWNQIAIGALQTSNGSNKETYGAALTVTLN